MQMVTSCISTTMVLLLLGLVVFFVMIAQNLSDYVRTNLTVTVLLSDDMSQPEAVRLQNQLKTKAYVDGITFISKDDALKEQTEAMGSDPSEFLGSNPFSASFELKMQPSYANSDSLRWIVKDIKKSPKVVDVVYQQALMDSVNANIKKISLILLVLAALLTCVSFGLINNNVRLSVYSKRFLIHTMKLVGASWNFIRRPFLMRSIWIGIIAAVVADALLLAGVNAMVTYEPEMINIITWDVLIVMTGSVFLFGILITLICAYFSVNKFLKMHASDLYKI